MNNYRKLNNLLGWITFAIASTVYLRTAEPTASWWDCGEYISTAFKFQVGHPPGAPTFQLLGRFFSLFAFGDLSKVAFMVNCMSALASGFTILFLFWSITAITKKLIKSNEMTTGQMWAILGSGLVGALAYTFSDSFWFSAVEGEVYAMSSFFTAVVFWAILKWEAVADQKHSNRWILLVAFLMGLSIGVHLLNLLAIPAISFIYYFKKYKTTARGVISTGVISIFLLAVVMYVIIPWVVKLAGSFELFFVNTAGLPFNSGTIIYFAVLIGAIVWGLIYTKKHNRSVLNTIILCIALILIGYSSFFMLVIRANANTPINENDPDDAIGLLSYLNREQYGDWPILYGQCYNAPVVDYKDGSPIYIKDAAKGKYIITDDRKQSISVFDPRFCTVFPRMWSNQKQSHITAYKEWGKIQGTPIAVTGNDGSSQTIYKPTFVENLRFFFTYQVGHMYLRYFMWNFAGRQNDIEGYGSIDNGNWISGISWLDNWRLGNQDNMPHSMQNSAKNKFYMLPLLLGLIGFIFHLNRRNKDAIVVALLFFMTGLAIVLYLNQTPYQPRERDYAYAGSFYAFAIWIGIGVFAIFDYLKKLKVNQTVTAIVVTFICLLLVPCVMAKDGWNDHDRSGKYACRDFAVDYLMSCEPNAILFTNGDNDTFPLWYAQEVEGIRRDVRVVNYMLASGDWYIHQLARKTYDSDPIKFTLTPDQYNKGVNEYIGYYEQVKDTVEVKDLISFIASDDPKSKITYQDNKPMSFYPTKHLKLTVDREKALKNGIVPQRFANRILKDVRWDIKSNYMYKNDIMLLDFLANNDWKRPIYFASPSTVSNAFNVEKYCQMEGWVYKFMPLQSDKSSDEMGPVDTYESYDILMNKCKWGNLNNPKVLVDRESMRNSQIPRTNFMRLAQALVIENKKDSAIKVLDRCLEVFPDSKVPFDIYMSPIPEIYYRAGAMQKGNKMVEVLAKIYEDNLNYYFSLPTKFSDNYDNEKQQNLSVLHRLAVVSKQFNQTQLSNKIENYVNQKIKLMK